MQRLLSKVQVHIDERLFVKDPLTSAIGKEILHHSILLIAKEGLEAFTFKKLATALESTESTIYRYFHNKQQLMMYLASWYWSLLEWRLLFATANVADPRERLERALDALGRPSEASSDHPWLDEGRLYRIVVHESFKAFVLKSLDKKERTGYFQAYELLIGRLAGLIQECSASYRFPQALSATIIETAHHQVFLSASLPGLTDITAPSADLPMFLHHLAFTALEKQ